MRLRRFSSGGGQKASGDQALLVFRSLEVISEKIGIESTCFLATIRHTFTFQPNGETDVNRRQSASSSSKAPCSCVTSMPHVAKTRIIDSWRARSHGVGQKPSEDDRRTRSTNDKLQPAIIDTKIENMHYHGIQAVPSIRRCSTCGVQVLLPGIKTQQRTRRSQTTTQHRTLSTSPSPKGIRRCRFRCTTTTPCKTFPPPPAPPHRPPHPPPHCHPLLRSCHRRLTGFRNLPLAVSTP